MPAVKLDEIDLHIIRVLQENARTTNLDLARMVALAPSACLRRVKHLEQSGVIQGYQARINPNLVGLPVSVFANVTLEKQIFTNFETFQSRVEDYPEVQDCYLMTGQSDYLLHVLAADVEDYKRFLMDFLSRIPGVAHIESSFALQRVKSRTALPLYKMQQTADQARKK